MWHALHIYTYTTSASTKGIALLMLALVVCMAAAGNYYRSRIAPIARIFFASATCFSTTEMTDFTDFVSIACSLRY